MIYLMALTIMAKTIIMAMTMPKVPKAVQEYERQLVRMLQDSSWEVFRKPSFLGEADVLAEKGNLKYAIELKRAPESRRDRVVPLLAEAILQAQAHAHKVPQARALAIIASRHLSSAVVDQALEFHHNYGPGVAVGFFDDRGLRVFRAPGLEYTFSPNLIN